MTDGDTESKQAEETSVEEREEEAPSIEDEFRALYTEAQGEGRRLKRLAMQVEQSGDSASATVLREVAGGLVQLLQDLIATTGGAFQEIEASLDGIEEESRLLTEDAEKLHGLLQACRKLVSELLAAGASGESKEGLEKLLALIDDQMGFVLEVSDYEPASSAN
jgi:hypothetical protein